MASTFTKTFTTFSGADIVCTFGGTVVGEIQAISVTVTREKTFVYTMGSPDPRSITRGKRAIGGSLIFVVFDREALVSTLRKDEALRPYMRNGARNLDPTSGAFQSNQTANASAAAANAGAPTLSAAQLDAQSRLAENDLNFNFADQILPFDIVITYANEYGNKAVMTLYGVEILSDGMGVSVDDLVVERQYSYIALSMKNLNILGSTGDTTKF